MHAEESLVAIDDQIERRVEQVELGRQDTEVALRLRMMDEHPVASQVRLTC